MSKDTNNEIGIASGSKSKVRNEVRFNLKSKKPKDKGTLISAVFRFGDDKLVYSTQQKIAPQYWDKSGSPRTTYMYYKEIKEELDKVKDAIIDIHTKRPKLSKEDLKEALDIKLGRKAVEFDSDSLLHFYKKYIALRANRPTAKIETIKNLTTTYNNLKKFSNGKDIKFDDIDWMFKENFMNWSYSKPREHSQNTLSKNMSMVILVMREAQKNKLHEFEIYKEQGFAVPETATSHIALTPEEVQLIFDTDFSDNLSLDKAKDLFLISCYSSLRLSDFKRIQPDNLVEMDGDFYLHMITEKTKEEVYIPVNENLLSILKKYDFKSPTISNQKLNKYIKDVCKEAGLTDHVMKHFNKAGQGETEFVEKWSLVSAHTGRRTWASTMYLQGYPIMLLMQCTGHTKESTFLKYIGISKKEQAKALMKQIKARKTEISQGAKVVQL